MKKPSSVAVLPFPLTAAALFGYGILRFLGHINEQTHTRFTRVSSHHDTLLGCEGRIVYLNCTELYLKILSAVEVEVDKHIRKVLSFAMFGDCSQNDLDLGVQTKSTHSRLLSALTKLDVNASRKALEHIHTFIVELQQIKTWRSLQDIEAFVSALEALEVKPSVISYPPDKRFLSLPVFKEGKLISKGDHVTGSFTVTLDEGRVFDLQNKHICLAVGGPANSGKSTLAVSLATEMENCIKSLKSRSSFSELEFSVGVVNLDLGTPTARAIAEGWAADRKKLEMEKRSWTIDLAEKAQKELLCSRARHNILIGDLPGRITDITQLLAGSADAGIIISRDQQILSEEWAPFMSSSGLPIVSRIKKREAEEGLSSLVTKRCPGESFNGRIVTLNRSQKSWDLFIQWLALFLLFDILPRQFDAGS